MGILDELKAQREAHERRVAEQEAQERQIKQLYENDLLPRLKHLFCYLNELTEHLNAMQVETPVGFQIPGAAVVEGYRQRDYGIRVDSEDRMGEITLTCECVQDVAPQFSVGSAPMRDHVRDFLSKQDIAFADRAKYDRHRQVTGYLFELAPRLRASLQIRVDRHDLTTRFAFYNLGALGWRDLEVRPHELTEDLFDRLGRYILREGQELFYLDMTEEERLALKARLAREERQRKLAFTLTRQYAPKPEEAASPAATINQLLQRVRSLASK